MATKSKFATKFTVTKLEVDCTRSPLRREVMQPHGDATEVQTDTKFEIIM